MNDFALKDENTPSVDLEKSKGAFTVDCPICYDQIDDIEEAGETFEVFGCEHQFCQTCVRHYCELSIEKRTLPIMCPINDCVTRCQNRIGDAQVHRILCPKNQPEHDWKLCRVSTAWNKYQRLQQLRLDPNLAVCPNCDSLVSSAGKVLLECPCGYIFCSIHGDMHAGMTCDEFKKSRKGKSVSRENALSQATVSKLTKPCSHCRAPIEKAAGCDHIICQNCQGDFCFKCGTHEFLSGEGTIRHCSECDQHFVDHRRICRHRIYICLQLPIMLPFNIVYTAAMSTFALISCCFCCWFGCGYCLYKELRPARAIKRVLICILYPFADLLQHFGMHSCEDLLRSFPNEITFFKEASTEKTDNSEKDDDSEETVSDIHIDIS